jgi:fibronectin-binding autotransporter adhesin
LISSSRMNCAPPFRSTFLALLLATLAYGRARADQTWKNTPGNTDFNAGTSWVSGTAPTNSDKALFTAAAVAQPNLSASKSVFALSFTVAGASGYDLTSSNTSIKLTLLSNGSGTLSAINAANSSLTNIIDAPLILGAGTNAIVTFAQATGGTLVINGAITSTNAIGSLSLTGGGNYTFAGVNSYSGTTLINAGTLLVNGNQSSATGAVSVSNSGSTLGGIGTIGGATTVNAGTKITGGTNGGIGTLTVSGTKSLTFTGASANFATYLADLGSGTNNSDRIAVGGALDLSNAFDRIMFQGSADGTSSYILATYGSLSGTFNTVTNLPIGYQLIYNPTELDLIPLVAVPEPGTWLAGGLALVTLLRKPLRRSARPARGA